MRDRTYGSNGLHKFGRDTLIQTRDAVLLDNLPETVERGSVGTTFGVPGLHSRFDGEVCRFRVRQSAGRQEARGEEGEERVV
jgi:hypothetical protein